MTGICFQCLTQNEKRPFQIVFLENISYTHFVASGTRSGLETSGRSHHDRFAFIVEGLQAPTTECFAIVNRKFGNRIERTHGDGRVYAWYAVEPVDEAFAAFYVFVIYVTVIILWRI